MFSVGKRGKVYDKFGNLRDDVEDDSLLGSSGEYSEQTVDGAPLVSSDRKGSSYPDKYPVHSLYYLSILINSQFVVHVIVILIYFLFVIF